MTEPTNAIEVYRAEPEDAYSELERLCERLYEVNQYGINLIKTKAWQVIPFRSNTDPKNTTAVVPLSKMEKSMCGSPVKAAICLLWATFFLHTLKWLRYFLQMTDGTKTRIPEAKGLIVEPIPEEAKHTSEENHNA
jgi:hypothetical protein